MKGKWFYIIMSSILFIIISIACIKYIVDINQKYYNDFSNEKIVLQVGDSKKLSNYFNDEWLRRIDRPNDDYNYYDSITYIDYDKNVLNIENDTIYAKNEGNTTLKIYYNERVYNSSDKKGKYYYVMNYDVIVAGQDYGSFGKINNVDDLANIQANGSYILNNDLNLADFGGFKNLSNFYALSSNGGLITNNNICFSGIILNPYNHKITGFDRNKIESSLLLDELQTINKKDSDYVFRTFLQVSHAYVDGLVIQGFNIPPIVEYDLSVLVNLDLSFSINDKIEASLNNCRYYASRINVDENCACSLAGFYVNCSVLLNMNCDYDVNRDFYKIRNNLRNSYVVLNDSISICAEYSENILQIPTIHDLSVEDLKSGNSRLITYLKDFTFVVGEYPTFKF